MSLLTSLTTSYATGAMVRDEVLIGVERRRRWPDEVKLEIVEEVGRNGWTVADVARRHGLTRQHIYQWRRELKRKGLWSAEAPLPFVEVRACAPLPAPCPSGMDAEAARVRIVLRSGRELLCHAGLDEAALRRLIDVLEAA